MSYLGVDIVLNWEFTNNFSPELKGLEIGNSATDKSIEVEAFVHEEQDGAGKYDDVYHFVSLMYWKN